MKLESRAYETRAVRDLRRDLPKHRKVLAVAPTGAGKTVIASLLVKREKRWKKVLWLAHRHELIDQAYATLTGLGLDVGVTMAQDERLHGDERVNPDARIQVASVQSIAARGVPKGIGLIVFDEAHRVMANSYQKIARAIPRAEVLGLTATPCRLDGKGLGSFFRHLLVMAKPSELHADGYLAKPRTFAAPPEVMAALAKGLKGATTSKGDYTPGSIARAVDNGLLIGKVVAESLRIAPGVPKVVFAGGVEHSKRLVAGFKRKGIRSAHLDGKTPAEERESILADLRAGRLEVVSNVDVLSEGWDLPALGAVVVARPTKSLARFLQMSGRVQRPYKRRVPIVIDHGANVQRFDLLPGQDVEWALDEGARHSADGDDPRFKECVECCAAMPWGECECPECGAEQPDRKTARQEREEVEAKLEEMSQTRLAELRERIEEMAKVKRAPSGWSQAVLGRAQIA